MQNEPYWLAVEDVVELNRDLVADTGEPHRILKAGELESACHRPRWLWEYEREDDVLVLAVRLLFGLARAHAFVQGNKRTGFVAALMFLEMNGWSLSPEVDSETLGDAIVAVLNGDIGEDAFADDIARFITPRAA